MTIANQDGYRIVIFTNDHAPPHVHVFKNEGEIIVYLAGENGDEAGRLWLRASHNLKVREERRAIELVNDYYVVCLEKWREIHD